MSDDEECQVDHERDIQACRKVFSTYDTQDSGFIDYYDLKDALEKMNITFSHSYVYFKMITDMQNTKENIGGGKFKKITFLIKNSKHREQVFTE